jgi:hypothetical protein
MAFRLLEMFKETLNGHKGESGKQKMFAPLLTKKRLTSGKCFESTSGSEMACSVHGSQLAIPSS